MSLLIDVPIQSEEAPHTNKRAFLYPPRKEKCSRKNDQSLWYQKRRKFDKNFEHVKQKSMVLVESELFNLQRKIECLRSQLHLLASQKGLAHQSVIELSQELDQYIVLYQQATHRKRVNAY